MRLGAYLLLLVMCATAHAQVTYTATPGTGYQLLDGATVSGAINVRLAGCPPGVWTYAIDGAAQADEKTCPLDMGGDNTLYDTHALPNGPHTITAVAPASTTTVHTARFTVANGPGTPGAPGWTGSTTLSWTAPTQNTDGSVLTDLAGYRIRYGSSAANLTQTVTLANPGLSTYTLTGLTAGTWYAGVLAYNAAGVDGDLSIIVSKTLTAPTCGPAPATETRSQVCPAPLVGNWSQTRGYLSIAAPACWQADAWLPTDPPAGVCASPALVTADTKAYEKRSATLPLALIGFVPAGIPCGPETIVVNAVKYCKVSKSIVDAVVWPADLTQTDFWARSK